MLQMSALKLVTVAIYVINSVNNTNLPCYTLSMMQHHSFFRNLPPLDLLHQTTPATLTAPNYTYCTKVHLLHQLLDFMIE